MWLAACLWAKKGVEMGVGWGSTPFSERKEHRGEGVSKILGNSRACGGPGRGEHSWGSPLMSVGKCVGVREWVGVSVCAGENRQAGGRASLELGEGLGLRGAPGSERGGWGPNYWPGPDLTVLSVLSCSEPQLHGRGAQEVSDGLHPAASPRTGKGISF